MTDGIAPRCPLCAGDLLPLSGDIDRNWTMDDWVSMDLTCSSPDCDHKVDGGRILDKSSAHVPGPAGTWPHEVAARRRKMHEETTMKVTKEVSDHLETADAREPLVKSLVMALAEGETIANEIEVNAP